MNMIRLKRLSRLSPKSLNPNLTTRNLSNLASLEMNSVGTLQNRMARFTPENYESNNLNGLEDIMYLSSKLGAKLTPIVEQLLTVMPECLAISLLAFSLKASVHAMVARVPDVKRKRQFNKIIEEVKKEEQSEFSKNVRDLDESYVKWLSQTSEIGKSSAFSKDGDYVRISFVEVHKALDEQKQFKSGFEKQYRVEQNEAITAEGILFSDFSKRLAHLEISDEVWDGFRLLAHDSSSFENEHWTNDEHFSNLKTANPEDKYLVFGVRHFNATEDGRGIHKTCLYPPGDFNNKEDFEKNRFDVDEGNHMDLVHKLTLQSMYRNCMSKMMQKDYRSRKMDLLFKQFEVENKKEEQFSKLVQLTRVSKSLTHITFATGLGVLASLPVVGCLWHMTLTGQLEMFYTNHFLTNVFAAWVTVLSIHSKNYLTQMNMTTTGPTSLAGSSPKGMEDIFVKKRKYMRKMNLDNQARQSVTGSKRGLILNKISMERADKDGGIMLFRRTQPLVTSKLLAMQNIPNGLSFLLASCLMTPLMFSCILPAPVTTYIASLMVGNVAYQVFSISPSGKKLLGTHTGFDNKSVVQQYKDFRNSVLHMTYVHPKFDKFVVYTPSNMGIFKNWYPGSKKLNLVNFDPHYRAVYYRYLSYLVFGIAAVGTGYHLSEDRDHEKNEVQV